MDVIKREWKYIDEIKKRDESLFKNRNKEGQYKMNNNAKERTNYFKIYFLHSEIFASNCDMLCGKILLSVASIIQRRRYIIHFMKITNGKP